MLTLMGLPFVGEVSIRLLIELLASELSLAGVVAFVYFLE